MGGSLRWSLYTLGVVGGVEVMNGNVDDKNSVEIHEKMSNGALFETGLEKDI
jgi:hypothetical protein